MVESNQIFFKERDLSFDIAKGIAIFLMVIGHTSIPKIANTWIYSFHMPLFFFVSGVFFNLKNIQSGVFSSLLKVKHCLFRIFYT